MWPGVELRHLVALKAVGEEGSFSRAAVRLGYTQSAISQQIAALERAVGAQVLERGQGRKAVQPTEVGRVVLRHADAIMARFRAAHADVAALAAGSSPRLRIGAYQSVGARIVPGLVALFRRRWPDVEIELAESTSDAEPLALVERAELDLAFAIGPIAPGPLESVEVMRDPYVLLVPADSELAGLEVVPLRGLARTPVIGFWNCRSFHELLGELERRGIELTSAFATSDNGTARGLVEAGLGFALVPRLCVDPDATSVAAIPLPADLPPRRISLARHADRHRSDVTDAFVELAKSFCADLESKLDVRFGGPRALRGPAPTS
jgi:DNA-binding transcriptional LysR family regulator